MALQYAHGAIQWLAADAVNDTHVVTGLGFELKLIRFFHVGLQSATDADSDAVHSRRGVGLATGTADRRCVASFSADAAATTDCATSCRNDSIVALVDGAAASAGRLDLSAVGSDGFTVIVDEVSAANITVMWEAWGGSDPVAFVVGDFAEPAATGNVDYTATGMVAAATDQALMVAGVQSTAALNSGLASDSGMTIGFATDSVEQVSWCGNQDDASAAGDADHYVQGGECLGMIVVGGSTVNARAAFVQWNTDGFRLNWISRATTGRKYIFAAIKGGNWQAGELTIDASTLDATATVSGLSFAPTGISAISAQGAEPAAGTSVIHDAMGVGCGSSPSSRRTAVMRDLNSQDPTLINTAIQYDELICVTFISGVVIGFDIDAMLGDGFRLINDLANVNGSTTHWIGYLTFGSAASSGISGTLDVTLDTVTLSAAATAQINGIASITLDAATLVATATLQVKGSATIIVADATIVSGVVAQIKAILARSLDDATLFSEITSPQVELTLEITLADATLLASFGDDDWEVGVVPTSEWGESEIAAGVWVAQGATVDEWATPDGVAGDWASAPVAPGSWTET